MTRHRATALIAAALATAGSAAAASAIIANQAGTLPATAGFPESITLAPGDRTYYVTSFASGGVYAGAVGHPAHLFLPPGNGRTSASGIKADSRGRLFVLTGAGARLQIISRKTRRIVGDLGGGTEAGASLNDLALAADGDLYITDSAAPRIYRVSAKEIARHRGPLKLWLAPPPTVVPELPGLNFNGIAFTAKDKYLLVGRTANGALYRITRRNRSIARIQIPGADLTGSDGMLLVRHTLYVALHGNAVAVMQLNRSYTRGHLVRKLVAPSLDFPTSVALAADKLLVTNGLKPPSASTYAITSIRRP